MSNLSDAKGTIEIVSESKKVREIIKKLFGSGNEIDEYSTYINGDWQEYERFLKNDQKEHYCMALFRAIGRNYYGCNIRNLINWYGDRISSDELSILKSNDWQIVYDYVDCDPEGCLFGNNEDIYVHKKDESFEKDEIIENGESLDIDKWTDYLSTGLADDLDDLIDYRGVYYEGYDDSIDEERFLDDFKYNKDYLVWYYKKPLDEICRTGGIFQKLCERTGVIK